MWHLSTNKHPFSLEGLKLINIEIIDYKIFYIFYNVYIFTLYTYI